MARGTLISSKLGLWLGLSLVTLTPACGLNAADSEGGERTASGLASATYRIDGISAEIDPREQWDSVGNAAPDVTGQLTVGLLRYDNSGVASDHSISLIKKPNTYDPTWKITDGNLWQKPWGATEMAWPTFTRRYLEEHPYVKISLSDAELGPARTLIDACVVQLDADDLAIIETPTRSDDSWSGWMTFDGERCLNNAYRSKLMTFRLHFVARAAPEKRGE